MVDWGMEVVRVVGSAVGCGGDDDGCFLVR